ncbi:MAG: peptidoglycan DD-metalloendopeptidase family protein [Chloroflexi bacterium]|nr:peptidoglycan DD-metalloendopeptidase family protein [Chloroflexota bacterium]
MGAQGAPCGIVDAIDYPIDISETLNERYDDFALFRRRFGGNHVGIDIGFNRWGETVYAAARGQVTYSDPEGWDTEKGVVIVRHVFPDQSIAYTLYGHMEQTDTLKFPPVGVCVEKGEPVGAIGWPSRGLPHLHYETRSMLPDDGGPGYVIDNPLLEGWYHPLDFTLDWQLRLAGGYTASLSFLNVPTLPPILLDTGEVVIATGDRLEAYTIDRMIGWTVAMPGVITGLSALPGGRVVAQARGGQVITLQNGRYQSVWQVDGLETPFQPLGETLVFATAEGGLAAYRPDGTMLWSHSGIGGGALPTLRAVDFSAGPAGSGQIALAVRREDGSVHWRSVDAAGALVAETTFTRTPAIAAYPGGWLALTGTELVRLTAGGEEHVTSLSPAPGPNARIAADAMGNTYVYLNDAEGTLLAVDSSGVVLWRTTYPWRGLPLAPVLRADNGCALYTLDVDGVLRVYRASDGELLAERAMYAGGVRNASPPARLLRPDGGNRLLISAGFLTLYLLDADAIAGESLSACVLG